jgi:diguanylate cyclase (GGDEF)-like protein
MMAVLRPYDSVGRYGGEEFLVVLPGCGTRVATTLAERLRQQVEADVLELNEQHVGITLSLGVAAAGGPGTRAAELLRIADAALYRAKAAGRNRTRVGKVPQGEPLPIGKNASQVPAEPCSTAETQSASRLS